MKNESRQGGRTEVLDDFVCHAELIRFPNTVPTSIRGDT